MKIGFIASIVMLIAACSSGPTKDSTTTAKVAMESDPSKGIICTYERPTGSFLKEKKCTTPEEREAERLQRGTLMDVRNERDSGIN